MSKERVDLNNNDEVYHDFDITQGINFFFQKGLNLTEKKYGEALEQFEYAKKLDANHENIFERKKLVHHCDYKSGLVYNKLAQKEVEPIQQKRYHEMAAYCFEETQANSWKDIFNGQDLNQLIATAYNNVGNEEKALQFLQKTTFYKLAKELEQKNSQELVIANPLQDNDNISPQHIREAIRYLFLEQQRQNIVQQEHGQRIGVLEQEVDKIKKTLVNANIYTKEDINTQIKELKDPDLYKYYKHFHSGLRSIYTASCVASSDAVVVNASHIERLKLSSVEKGVCCLFDFLAAGYFRPIITGLLSILHDLGDNIYNSSVEEKLSDFLKKFYIIFSKQYDENMDFEWHLKQIALFFTDLRKDEILNVKPENVNDSFWNFCKQKILPIQNKFFKNKDKEMIL